LLISPVRALTRPIPSLARRFGGAAHAAAPLNMCESRLRRLGTRGKKGAERTDLSRLIKGQLAPLSTEIYQILVTNIEPFCLERVQHEGSHRHIRITS
jgi:hypothetical protein